MEKANVYIPIIESLKELEDTRWAVKMTGREIREQVITMVISSEGLDEENRHAVGFACNDLVAEGYISKSNEGFKLHRNKMKEIYNKYR